MIKKSVWSSRMIIEYSQSEVKDQIRTFSEATKSRVWKMRDNHWTGFEPV